jgi:hypothetical protein
MGRARVIEREIEVGMGIVQTVVASWLQGKLMHDRIPKPATRCGFDPIRQVLLKSPRRGFHSVGQGHRVALDGANLIRSLSARRPHAAPPFVTYYVTNGGAIRNVFLGIFFRARAPGRGASVLANSVAAPTDFLLAAIPVSVFSFQDSWVSFRVVCVLKRPPNHDRENRIKRVLPGRMRSCRGT